MARPLRIEYENAVYHITSRGNEQQAIYRSDKDRRRFLDILGDVVKRYRWICHAYCLMDNHYHLLIETPLANISRGMRHLNGVYTQAFNYVHRRVGHLFQGRFRGILVEKQEHLLEVARYIVLNPVRARVCDRAEDYLWSSYNGTVGRMDCPDFLYPDWILSQFGTSERLEAQARYERFVRDGIEGNPWEELKGQIYLGSEAFVRSLQEYHSESEEIPRAQRNPLRIDLKTLLKTEEGIRRAYHEHWYSLKEIAAHLGVHYATISRRLKRLEEKETKLLAMLHCKT
ncbi:MAG: transposase [Elusimicrobia bacterium]|nr:transposase [Elusimicrobiota bacterium]